MSDGREPVEASQAERPLARDAVLDRLVGLVAALLEVPGAVLALFDGGRARIVAQVGLDPDAARRAVPAVEPLTDARTRVIPDVGGEGRVLFDRLLPTGAGFYVGTPLSRRDGAVFGVICALDTVARPMPSGRDIRRLDDLAALACDALAGREAVETAEALAESRTELLADLSHELRTPLNGIVGFAEILRRDGAGDDRALRSLERIEDASRGLLAIVGDALDLAKLGSGAVRLDARPFSASRLVEDTAALVRPDADRKGLALAVDLPGTPLGPVLGDPDRLRQVLLNLLANALKFTEAGTVRVSLAAAGGEAGRPVSLTFVVADSGVGIASDGIPRLFQRFAQADGTIARRFGGTGLGLAISKSLVEAMGGTIAVVSAPGAGARFTVTLSLPPAVVPVADRPDGAASRRPEVTRDALKGSAVLLAEDVSLNQKLAVQLLAPLGAEVDVVGDGLAAVAAVARRDYALVLMDMEMPVLGGLDATRRIRALGGPAGSVPIVALTANVFPEQLALCRAAGMDDHLTKPFGADDLAAKVLRWARRLAPVG
jgi:signal transduction histidine kinase/CheY-like chemotaxis protein